MRISKSTSLVLIPLVALAIACGAGTSTRSGGVQSDTAAGSAAPGESAAAEQTGPATVKIGEPLTLTEDVFGSKTVAVITLSNFKTGYKSGNQFDKSQKGQYVIADIAVAVTAGKFSISSGDFKLVAADGTAYDPTYVSTVPMFMASDLTPGQKSSGKIAFDIAKGAEKGAKVALKNLLAEGDAGYWTLP